MDTNIYEGQIQKETILLQMCVDKNQTILHLMQTVKHLASENKELKSPKDEVKQDGKQD